MDKQKFSEEELRARLSEEEYRVTQEKGTEAPFSGLYTNTKKKGLYTCVVCGAPLFESDTKFDSSSGWPSFTCPVSTNSTEEHVDKSLEVERTEVVCSSCGAHLGHVFNDGPESGTHPHATGMRYCINSAALNLEEK